MTSYESVERICELKGSIIALDAVLVALVRVMPIEQRSVYVKSVRTTTEVARTVLLNSSISETSVEGFERDVARWLQLLRPLDDDRGHVSGVPRSLGARGARG